MQNKQKNNMLKGLYGISDCTLTPHNTIMQQLQMAINGGLRIFQYRDKLSNDEDIKHIIKELQDFCSMQNILFVLNDRYELAMKLNAGGLHLGRDEVMNFDYIRKEFKGIIGVSCYDNIDMAKEFEIRGADYVAFGSMFESKTKKNATICKLDILKQAKSILNIPICAIGGIDKNNARLLKHCDMIAVISNLWDTKNTITSNAENILSSWNLNNSFNN